MTAKIQISKKFPDGTILVLGGDTYAEFNGMLTEAVSEDSAEHVRELIFDFAETGVKTQVVEERSLRIGEAAPDRLGRY